MTPSVEALFLGHSVRKLEQMERMIQGQAPAVLSGQPLAQERGRSQLGG
jgi:hypothetical protein